MYRYLNINKSEHAYSKEVNFINYDNRNQKSTARRHLFFLNCNVVLLNKIVCNGLSDSRQ